MWCKHHRRGGGSDRHSSCMAQPSIGVGTQMPQTLDRLRVDVEDATAATPALLSKPRKRRPGTHTSREVRRGREKRIERCERSRGRCDFRSEA